MFPPAADISQAIALLTDPARAAARPGARSNAWATLKAARGQTHALSRLDPAPRIAETQPPEPLASFLQRRANPIRARILARAAEHGIGPGPTGGDAA